MDVFYQFCYCKLDDIVRDMKSFTSTELNRLIKGHPQESRRE